MDGCHPYLPLSHIVFDGTTNRRVDRQAGRLAGGQTVFIIIFIFPIKKKQQDKHKIRNKQN